MSTSPSWWTSTSNHLLQSQKVPAAYAAGTFLQAASSGPHGTWGGAYAPSKRFGPQAQNLDAGGIHFRRADQIPGSPSGNFPDGACRQGALRASHQAGGPLQVIISCKAKRSPPHTRRGPFYRRPLRGPMAHGAARMRRPSVLGHRPKTLMPAEFISAEQIRSRGPRQGIP